MRAHQRRDRGEQRGMGERQALDALVLGGVPGLGQIFERELPLFALLVRAGVVAKSGMVGLP